MKKQYLGDSVYAEYDGYHVVLTTENGGPPSNTIALEPQVMDALYGYVKALGERLKAELEAKVKDEQSDPANS